MLKYKSIYLYIIMWSTLWSWCGTSPGPPITALWTICWLRIFPQWEKRFLGGHHLHMWLCVSVIEKTWVRGYSTKFPRSNGCRGLKFSFHFQKGRTRWKMVKMTFGVPPPPQKKIIWGAYKNLLSKMKKIRVVQNCLKWREKWSKTIFGFFSPPQIK